MKVVRVLALATAVAALPSAAYLGELVASFNAPANLPSALAASGDSVYVYCYGRYMPPMYHIFCLDSSTGSCLYSFQSPFQNYTSGLGYEYGGYLWISRYSPNFVARCNATTGSVYSSFAVTEHSLGGGIACQGDPTRPSTLAAIISNGTSPYLCTRHRTSGSLIGSFATTRRYFDPAWDYRNAVIWLPAYETPTRRVYAYTVAGSAAASFGLPSSCYMPGGAAYANNYLYVTNNGNPPYIVYKFHCPSIWQRVTGTSIGRVKALYR